MKSDLLLAADTLVGKQRPLFFAFVSSLSCLPWEGQEGQYQRDGLGDGNDLRVPQNWCLG